MPETALQWLGKNWLKVIIASAMIIGIAVTFNSHTSGIAALNEQLEEAVTDLEEANSSLKELVADMKEDASEIYTKNALLSADVGRLRESLDRIETILMND